MDPNVALAVRSKRILVFKKMLIETGFPDLGVVDELIKGASLTGEVPSTGMLPGKFTPAVASESEICAAAARIRPNGDSNIDKEVWRKTMEKVDKIGCRVHCPVAACPVTNPSLGVLAYCRRKER